MSPTLPPSFRSARLRLLGVVWVTVAGLFLSLTVALYADVFSDNPTVTLHTDHAGSQLRSSADVRIRGLIAGRVETVRSVGDGAVLVLEMDPEMVGRIPRNVSARLLPKTLFGERYVSLVEPSRPEGHLTAGDVIGQDRSAVAVELERVFDRLLPLLRSVRPDELAATLTSLSQALAGKGEKIGETLTRVERYLTQVTPQLPDVVKDISEAADTADVYDRSSRDFLNGLSDLTVTSKTVLDQKDDLAALYRSLTGTSQDLRGFLAANQDNLIRLADSARPTLDILARYSPQYVCMLTALTSLEPKLDKAFGKDSGKPGIHVRLKFVKSRGPYRPGADAPRYDDKRGPRCYGGSPGAAERGRPLANSPAESGFLRGLLAPVLGVDPGDVPSWSGLLVGPVLRGTEVEVG